MPHGQTYPGIGHQPEVITDRERESSYGGLGSTHEQAGSNKNLTLPELITVSLSSLGPGPVTLHEIESRQRGVGPILEFYGIWGCETNERAGGSPVPQRRAEPRGPIGI